MRKLVALLMVSMFVLGGMVQAKVSVPPSPGDTITIPQASGDAQVRVTCSRSGKWELETFIVVKKLGTNYATYRRFSRDGSEVFNIEMGKSYLISAFAADGPSSWYYGEGLLNNVSEKNNWAQLYLYRVGHGSPFTTEQITNFGSNVPEGIRDATDRFQRKF